MKKRFAIFLFLALFILVGCSNEKKKSDTPVEEKLQVENVSMVIKEGTLTRNGVVVIITDTNNPHYDYGNPFRIDKKEKGKWKTLKAADNTAFTLPAYSVDENNQLELSQSWDFMYGTLEDGEYRLVKDVCIDDACKKKEYFSVEFTINDEIVNKIYPEQENLVIVDKIKDTKKIIVYNVLTKKKEKTITKVEEIVDILSYAQKLPVNVHLTSEVNEYELSLYDKQDKLLETISVWKTGTIGFHGNKEYQLNTKKLIEIIEGKI